MSVENPNFGEKSKNTYEEQILTENEFVHPDGPEYPDVEQSERLEKKRFEVFHDGVVESFGAGGEQEYDATIERLEKEGYEVKKSVSIGAKALSRTLMIKGKDFVLR